MSETIEIDVPEPVALMLEELREEYGDEQVDADLAAAVRQAVASGYATL